jgi:hypothetical protein
MGHFNLLSLFKMHRSGIMSKKARNIIFTSILIKNVVLCIYIFNQERNDRLNGLLGG